MKKEMPLETNEGEDWGGVGFGFKMVIAPRAWYVEINMLKHTIKNEWRCIKMQR